MDQTIIVAIIMATASIVAAIIAGIFSILKAKNEKQKESANSIKVGENIITADGQSSQTVNIFNSKIYEEHPAESQTAQAIYFDKTVTKKTDVPYRVLLGKQHKTLREKYLKLTIREMADFYKFDKASALEIYETGKNELPKACVESVANFFFVNKGFLEKGDAVVFKTEYVFGDSIRKLFYENFKPFFLVRTKPREGLYTYPILHKSENGFSRAIALNLSSFHSDGGGRHNVENIIRLMIETNIEPYEAPVLQVSQEIWEQLQNEEFYCKDPYTLGLKDFDCQDILVEWYSNVLKKS